MAEEQRVPYGMKVHQGQNGIWVEVQCAHQNGVLYAVPAEASWVCTQDLLHAHALAGFFQELVALDDPRVYGLMQRWGLYFRPRPIAKEEEQR